MNSLELITRSREAYETANAWLSGYDKLESREAFEMAILAYNRDLLPLEGFTNYREIIRAETALRRAQIAFCPPALLRFWYRDLPM